MNKDFEQTSMTTFDINMPIGLLPKRDSEIEEGPSQYIDLNWTFNNAPWFHSEVLVLTTSIMQEHFQ